MRTRRLSVKVIFTGVILFVGIIWSLKYCFFIEKDNSSEHLSHKQIGDIHFEDIRHVSSHGHERYFIYVSKIDFGAMLRYARQKPHRLGKCTWMLFFNDKEHIPQEVSLPLSYKYDNYVVAGYWKWVRGQEDFKKYPFKGLPIAGSKEDLEAEIEKRKKKILDLE